MNESRDRRTLIAGAYIAEGLLLLAILLLYRLEDKPDLPTFFSSPAGLLFVAAALLFFSTTLSVTLKYRTLRKLGSRPLRRLLKKNLVPVVLAVFLIEMMLRLVSTESPMGTMIGGTLLNPHRFWKAEVLRYSQQDGDLRNFDNDPLLGWKVRPNLSSQDGLYFTSREGIRSIRPGISLTELHAACRVAVVGDSHTFGSELKVEDTWAYQLQRTLPTGCLVLNFGVSGYSVGQMYLRYLRDIRPWHPHLVILALSSDAAGRSMGVYGFNIFSVFAPWAQPRFHIENGKLKPVNLPLPTHQEIASSQAASELPFLDYDWYFNPAEWDLPHWRCLYRSYLFRLYTTWYPLWRLHPNTNRDSLESLNHHLLRSFVETATAERTAAVVIYLPDKVDYQDPGRRETTSLRVLRSSGMEYYDLVPCLEPIAPGNRFLPHGIHYSPVAGVAIARCLHPTIAKKLPAQKTST